MLNPFRRIVDFYWRFLVSPIDYARHIGVFVGENSFIATRKWSSEPYLITSKHSKKCTFYTLRFDCSFAAVNTIKPQLL